MLLRALPLMRTTSSDAWRMRIAPSRPDPVEAYISVHETIGATPDSCVELLGIRPLLFGAAWKVLDLLLEEAFIRQANRLTGHGALVSLGKEGLRDSARGAQQLLKPMSGPQLRVPTTQPEYFETPWFTGGFLPTPLTPLRKLTAAVADYPHWTSVPRRPSRTWHSAPAKRFLGSNSMPESMLIFAASSGVCRICISSQ